MTHSLLFLVANITSLLCGLGTITLSWLIGVLLLNNILAIFEERDTADERDYQKSQKRDFDKGEANIKMSTFKKCVISAGFFGIGFLVKTLF